MSRALRWGAVAAVAALAAWWWLGRDPDERAIGRQIERALELAEKQPGETQLAGLERAREIAELFAADFEVRARPLDFATRDRRELARAIVGYRAGAERIWARIEERELYVDEASRRAAMPLTVEFGQGVSLGRARDAYRFQVSWVEEDGEWRMDSVELVEVVQGGGM